MTGNDDVVGPVDPQQVPRYAGLPTFARLPQARDVERYAVAVLGAPFDGGLTFRPGARFGPNHVREASRLLRTYNPDLEVATFLDQQVVDAGDAPCHPFELGVAHRQIEESAAAVLGTGAALLTLGGDHSVSLPLLRAVAAARGPVQLVHLDAHMDTYDTYFDEPFNHGTPFRRAHEEGLLTGGVHIGIRGATYGPQTFANDEAMGFQTLDARAVAERGAGAIAAATRDALGDGPVYLSVDIDVLDPAFAPATGTPEPGGLATREVLWILHDLVGIPLVAADLVEVSPPYDAGGVTGLAASQIAYEILSLFARLDA